MRLALAQFNPTVGDLSGNAQKISAWVRKAASLKSDLVVFPEMALCGYPVWDLANKKSFIRENKKQLARIAKVTSKLSVSCVVGFIDTDRSGSRGKSKSYNAAAWIEAGKIKAIYHKQLLPTYDVFLEDIFFWRGEKPCIVNSRLGKVGLTICEDLWDRSYDEKPLKKYAGKKTDWILNISASPYFKGVDQKRKGMLKAHALHYKKPFVYVNQVGGQDDLIFDGRSLVVNEKGKVVFEGAAFQEELLTLEMLSNQTLKDSKFNFLGAEKIGNEYAELYEALKLGVRDYFRKNGFKKAVIGLSGGIDSALVACLAVDALGPEAVKGITMPSKFSSKGSWKDSLELAKNLGVECPIHPIKEAYDLIVEKDVEYKKTAGTKPRKKTEMNLAKENLQARLRGLWLMFVSNDEGRLLLTTGNKSELAMGYCTLYGDMAGGLAVLGDLYKTQVFALSEYRNTISKVIPQNILTKPPSAELRPNQKDEDSLPPYEILDEILQLYIEKNLSVDDIVKRMRKKKVKAEIVREAIRKTDHNEYKRRQTPPVLRVSEKAWFGRRMPITNAWK